MNGIEVLKLKKRSKSEISETIRQYDSWIKKTQFLPNKAYLIAGIVSAVALYFLHKDNHTNWVIALLQVLFIVSFATIIQRNGHAEGYLYGYNDGFDEGINKALGIDEAGKKQLDDIATDASMRDSL